MLDVYSKVFPHSILAANIKACNVFRLCEDKKAALDVIETSCDRKAMADNAFIQQNTAVFEAGQKAFKVLPDLLEKVPEAKLNLAIYYLRQNEVEAAAELLQSVEAVSPQSHALIGVLNTQLGQARQNPELLTKAMSHFQTAGSSPADADTILGRQCMASYLMLLKEYENALVYLGRMFILCDQVLKRRHTNILCNISPFIH